MAGSVLFRVDIEVVVKRNGAAAKHAHVTFKVTGVHSHAKLRTPTGIDGKATLRLETRISGTNTITPLHPEFASSTFDVDIDEALYEGKFTVTGYNVADENDFSG